MRDRRPVFWFSCAITASTIARTSPRSGARAARGGRAAPPFSAGSLSIFAYALAAGCAQIAGVDDYAVRPSPPGDAGKHEPPPLPALSDVASAGCRTCAESKCKKERDECLLNAACRQMLECHGICEHPDCIARCRGANKNSDEFNDYFGCVFGTAIASPSTGATPPGGSRCLDAAECDAGHWGCVGKFRWDARGDSVDVRIHDVTAYSGPLSTLYGVEISSCDDLLGNHPDVYAGCNRWKPLDAYGSAADVPLGESDIFALRGGGERQRIYTEPLPSSGAITLPVFSTYLSDLYINPEINGFDPGLGVLYFQSFDCLGQIASAQIELTPPATGIRLYLVGYGIPDLTSSVGTVGGFVNVPILLQQVEITASLARGRVSRHTVTVAPGYNTTVYLYPMTIDEAGL